ncbi:MAG: phage protease [Burkholderiaceae bacterium]|nr:phage protease [Burkholderiaceae bacterium]
MFKRSRVSMGALVALAAMAGVAASAAPEGRHFLLEDNNAAPGTVRFLSQVIELGADTSKPSWVTVTRTGDFTDPRYGQFSITPTMLAQMVSNFDKRVTGQDVYIDVAHKHSDGAAAKVVKLEVVDTKLRALVEWTPFGVSAVKDRGFAYLSAEFHEAWTDNEKGAAHGCVLLGAGLTIRPVIKHLDPVQLSTDDNEERPYRLLLSPTLLKQLTETDMNKHLKALLARLIALGFTEMTAKPFTDLAEKQLEAVKDDEAKCLALVEVFATTADAALKQIKAAGGDGKTVTIQLAAPQTVDVAGEVARLLTERETAQAGQKTALAAKVTLLSTEIAAGDKTLTPEGVKKFADDYAPMITAVTTDDQVKHLAAMVVKQAQELSAARKLAGLGYNPASGNVHITVDDSNSINKLQEHVDKRLSLTDEKDPERFKTTGGQLLPKNKAFAARCLAEFDQLHGRQLFEESKKLAAGVGSVSDVAVPKIAERTVLREALYGLMSLGLVDVGTSPFSNVITIPYSYRDTTAAGVEGLRRYEGQAIRKGGIIQTEEETRPIPQKLAFQLSSEMRMLLGDSVINFEPVAENMRNMVRIVGEDVEAINLNELAMSADEYGATAVVGEVLTANVNGVKRIFPVANFPVVKPRKVYDLKGVQQGTTANPIVVTLNAVVREEFRVNADGTALAAGIYYVMNYNLGELEFVDEAGVAVVPTNAWVLTISYSYSTNANKFDTDLGADAVDVHYDKLLFAIGGRKAVIEDDRFYSPNMILMSGNVNNALSQAKSFQANSARVATGLASDGSVGFVKDMPVWRPRAPRSAFGDTRILVGERGTTRFRMVKPWSVNPMEQARDGNGAFIDAQESFGTQWVGSHTPTQLKSSKTSVILYSATGRVARA